MHERMSFPKKWEDFIKEYKFADIDHKYTSCFELIPVFRVEQMIAYYFISKETLKCMDSSIKNLENAVPIDIDDLPEEEK